MTKETIKFLTAGSVDDGKSTLIGRLLHDVGGLFDDQIEEVRAQTSRDFDGELDFSLFLDGLLSERAQKITIDVAYRYFSYLGRKFIIADAPGHVEYTRNMAVAASNSDIVVILVDATKGVIEQSLRHARVADLFGIRNVVVAVNKMDLTGYSQDIFVNIRGDFLAKTADLGFVGVEFVPISALAGQNIVERSRFTPWFEGKTVVESLLSFDLAGLAPLAVEKSENVRFLVQNVVKDGRKRLYQGFLASVSVRVGDELRVAASQNLVKVAGVFGEGEALALTLDREVDLDRGGVLFDQGGEFRDNLRARLIWFSRKGLSASCGGEFVMKINHSHVNAQILGVEVAINDIVEADLTLDREVFFDLFKENKFSGSFLLIDKRSNETVACGVVVEGEVEERKIGFFKRIWKWIC